MASFSVNCLSASPDLLVAARVNLTQIDWVSYRSRPLHESGSSLAGPAFKVSASVNSTVATNVVPQFISLKEKKEARVPDAASILAFMNQVADLIELVDSRDIVELQLKQTKCEITMRKKNPLQPLPVAPPAFMMHQPPLPPSVATAPSPISKAVLAPSTALAALPPKPSTSSHPRFKSPMAGTFYRSPAPGAPPFVKVGDKVQKGQVVCIIETMKLMNEIAADQAGTVVEILINDAKPVSVDTVSLPSPSLNSLCAGAIISLMQNPFVFALAAFVHNCTVSRLAAQTFYFGNLKYIQDTPFQLLFSSEF